MKVILVDDEQLPLKHLQAMLGKLTDIQITGTYLNPLEAEEVILKLRPDVVFLDIEMPHLNGLQLGERIQEICPEIEIIFVTAFDKYAVQAFELYAIDYMMKPISFKRLKATLNRLKMRRKGKILKSDVQMNDALSCFDTIGIIKSNGETEVIKWRTGKAQELFAYLLHHQGQVVYRDTILDLLWPDFDVSRGVKQLYTTIYHIRKTLKAYQLDEVVIGTVQLDHGYRLEIGNTKIDAVSWVEQVLNAQSETTETIALAEQILRMYKGDYLGKYDYVWAEAERERLRKLFLGYASRLHLFYFERQQFEKAIEVNQYVQRKIPSEEISYFNLMQLYAALGNEASVHDQYFELVHMMNEHFDALPTEYLTNWYEAWQKSL